MFSISSFDFIVLIDFSGSMASTDTVKDAFAALKASVK